MNFIASLCFIGVFASCLVLFLIPFVIVSQLLHFKKKTNIVMFGLLVTVFTIYNSPYYRKYRYRTALNSYCWACNTERVATIFQDILDGAEEVKITGSEIKAMIKDKHREEKSYELENRLYKKGDCAAGTKLYEVLEECNYHHSAEDVIKMLKDEIHCIEREIRQCSTIEEVWRLSQPGLIELIVRDW